MQIMVHFYHFNWSYGIFTNLSNLITHFTLSSLMNIKEKINETTKSCNFNCQFIFFSYLITNIFATRIYSLNSHWIRCHVVFSGPWTTSRVAKKLHCHLFAQPLKMDDISAFLIFIFIQWILVTICNCICNFKM